MKKKYLFVCIENSCRSQMAEGFARLHGGENVEAWSAGSRPSGKVNEKAIQSMLKIGVNLKDSTSKGLNDLPQGEWDHIITMGCGDECPYVPAKSRADWEIPDPKNMSLEDFSKVRDLIENKVKELLAPTGGHGGPPLQEGYQ